MDSVARTVRGAASSRAVMRAWTESVVRAPAATRRTSTALTLVFARRTGAATGTPIRVSDGQKVETVGVKLPRGGVISGTITDEFGDPSMGTAVRPMRFVYSNGQRYAALIAQQDITDDRGTYRLSGLPPGEYIVTAVPNELIDASRVDGCSTIRVFWHVVMPAVRPAAAVLGLLTFLNAWNDFFWPLILFGQGNEDLYSMQLGLAQFTFTYQTLWPELMAGSIIAILPILVIFLIFQRFFIAGVTAAGVKG